MKVSPCGILKSFILVALFSVLAAGQRPNFITKGSIKKLLTKHKNKFVTPSHTTAKDLEELFQDVQHVTPKKNSVDLAHVVSWNDISGVIKKCWSNTNFKVNDFIEFLTEVDTEAVIWEKKQGGQGYASKKHEDLLNGNGNILHNLNIAIREEAKAAAKSGKNQDRQRLKKLLNSSPANLRYGDSSRNRNIQKFLDPMGNTKSQLTEKEKIIVIAVDKHYKNYGKQSSQVWTNGNYQKYISMFQAIKTCFGQTTLEGTYYGIWNDPTSYDKTTENGYRFDPVYIDTTTGKNRLGYALSSSQLKPIHIPKSFLSAGKNGDTINLYIKYD